ncbi:MAG: hypothetical protein ACYC5G_05015 [Candidatus Doudnabacteria bacterium]
MEEKKLLVIEHKDLAGRTLIVPKEVSEDGKLVLDENGQATLPHNAAHFLCTIPGFSIVGQSKKKEEPEKVEEPAEEEQEHDQEHDEKTDQEPDRQTPGEQEAKDEEAKVEQKYPEGDPNPNWKKEELAAWLTEKEIEFKSKEGKEVLLGKAFKFLESSKTTE